MSTAEGQESHDKASFDQSWKCKKKKVLKTNWLPIYKRRWRTSYKK
jgi:hypothetical protein